MGEMEEHPGHHRYQRALQMTVAVCMIFMERMGILVGKLSLYIALNGIILLMICLCTLPSRSSPVRLPANHDSVRTNNDTLLNEEFYIGLKQRRAIVQLSK
ncbi:hypothetical protein GUJ93_ZPchr0015g6899 [Zizania palustris]|uniref:Malic enzyme N-terminal domain-containing protein n=1 Tax=Zizania palustris TaxID=103762 RepID=A0A8J5TGK5_ZIZPA|nr:hypothetical protein GUJ93_ZPchr0015g6899 [Zizania palustris]